MRGFESSLPSQCSCLTLLCQCLRRLGNEAEGLYRRFFVSDSEASVFVRLFFLSDFICLTYAI